METDVACCVRISLGLEVRAGNRCMRSATSHDEQRTPAGGASVLLERRQHTIVVSTRDDAHCEAIVDALGEADYAVEQLGPPA